MKDVTCRNCGVIFQSVKLSRKWCDDCRVIKKREEHHKAGRGKKYWADPDRRRALQERKWQRYTRNPAEWMLMAAKQRANQKGLPFSIKPDDIVLPQDMLCPILGITMKSNFGNGGGNTPHSPSLDMINPVRGYVPGNVCVISLKANRMKQDCTLEDLKRLVSYVENGGKII
jgi:hypothetical protein